MATSEITPSPQHTITKKFTKYTTATMSNHHSCTINNNTNNFLPLLLLVITLLLTIQSTFGCRIHNSNSGVCTKKYLPTSTELDAIEEAKTRWQADLPYCGRFVASYYSPCVPSKPTDAWIAPDANFPNGRLAASDQKNVVGVIGGGDEEEDVHSIRNKDAWVEQTVTRTIQARIDLEKQQGSSHYHYFRNKDCQEAYARYTCWLNFPRCSDEFDETLPMCQSGESHSLVRCHSLVQQSHTFILLLRPHYNL